MKTYFFVVKTLKRSLAKLGLYGNHVAKVDFQGQEASDKIKELILAGNPFMACRYGGTEISAISRYFAKKQKIGVFTKTVLYLTDKSNMFWFDEKLASRMRILSGFFNPSYENMDRFSELILDESQNIDLLGCWLHEEKYIQSCFGNATKIPLGDLEPYYHSLPWSSVLRNKRVLVIHPFEDTIKNQFKIRREIHKNQEVLPDFELLTYKPVQSLGDEDLSEFNDWFEALEKMKNDVSKMDFDIALIAAGAYGFPLAAHIKSIGRQAIHMGGALQVLFGIKGKRWEDDPNFNTMIVDSWVYPSKEEKPKGFEKVENGCYW